MSVVVVGGFVVVAERRRSEKECAFTRTQRHREVVTFPYTVERDRYVPTDGRIKLEDCRSLWRGGQQRNDSVVG